jgi:hypothetical protein
MKAPDVTFGNGAKSFLLRRIQKEETALAFGESRFPKTWNLRLLF